MCQTGDALRGNIDSGRDSAAVQVQAHHFAGEPVGDIGKAWHGCADDGPAKTFQRITAQNLTVVTQLVDAVTATNQQALVRPGDQVKEHLSLTFRKTLQVGQLFARLQIKTHQAWTGLGYNSRALRLREAARIVKENGWPTTPEALSELPGVGPYTAAAVASFAFGAQVPAVDTNLRRVLSRWYGESLNGAALEAAAKTALGEPAGDWNQAMMDLGAMVCLPKSPRCTICPVKDWCSGPAAYRPPTAQGRFEGSARQLRGAIIRTLVRHTATIEEIVQQTGFSAVETEAALTDLISEDLIERTVAGTYQIAD